MRPRYCFLKQQVEKVDKNEKFIEVVDCEDKEDDDWLPPPPKVSADNTETWLRILFGYHFRQLLSILMWMMAGRRSLMKGCSKAIVLCQEIYSFVFLLEEESLKESDDLFF
ncbi:hypothetical protein ACSBR1_008767 [Camellia fascicularis]